MPSTAGATPTTACGEGEEGKESVMVIGRVVKTVTSTIKDPGYTGHKLLAVQPVTPSGSRGGNTILAVDTVQAGVGDLVLVMREGNGVRQILEREKIPIRSLIVGIIDEIEMSER